MEQKFVNFDSRVKKFCSKSSDQQWETKEAPFLTRSWAPARTRTRKSHPHQCCGWRGKAGSSCTRFALASRNYASHLCGYVCMYVCTYERTYVGTNDSIVMYEWAQESASWLAYGRSGNLKRPLLSASLWQTHEHWATTITMEQSNHTLRDNNSICQITNQPSSLAAHCIIYTLFGCFQHHRVTNDDVIWGYIRAWKVSDPLKLCPIGRQFFKVTSASSGDAMSWCRLFVFGNNVPTFCRQTWRRLLLVEECRCTGCVRSHRILWGVILKTFLYAAWHGDKFSTGRSSPVTALTCRIPCICSVKCCHTHFCRLCNVTRCLSQKSYLNSSKWNQTVFLPQRPWAKLTSALCTPSKAISMCTRINFTSHLLNDSILKIGNTSWSTAQAGALLELEHCPSLCYRKRPSIRPCSSQRAQVIFSFKIIWRSTHI